MRGRDDFFVVFDIGAQTGCFTLLAKYFPHSKWYAFEPIEEIVRELYANILLNEINNFQVYPVCVSDHISNRSLRLPIDNHWGLATLGEKPRRFNEYNERVVSWISLDEFIVDQSIDKVNFIKIDTEGWELFILKGARALIERCRPIILMECNKENMAQCSVIEEQIFQFLKENNYTWELVSSEDILCLPL